MRLFGKRAAKAEEQRRIDHLPWISGGPAPSHVTTENAASLVPVFASMRILADGIASLPIDNFRKVNGKLTPNSYIPPLFYKPAIRDTRFQWVHKCIVSLVLRGNAYGLVTARDQLGFPSMVEWLHPDDVWVDETSPVDPIFYWQGKKQRTEDIVHIPWVVMPGRAVGLSPMQVFAATLGVGLATTEYGRRWFDNGGTPPSVVRNTQKQINPDESKEIRKRVGQSIHSGQPLVIGSDWEYTAIPVSPEESQFIQTQKLNATQIAAIYGVPAEMVGGEAGSSLTYSTVEQNTLNLSALTFRPWIVRLEEAFSALLASAEEVRFNADAMVRTNTLVRYQGYGLALTQGWMNLDDVRAKENLPPLPNGQGKTYATPGATAPAEEPSQPEGEAQ